MALNDYQVKQITTAITDAGLSAEQVKAWWDTHSRYSFPGMNALHSLNQREFDALTRWTATQTATATTVTAEQPQRHYTRSTAYGHGYYYEDAGYTQYGSHQIWDRS